MKLCQLSKEELSHYYRVSGQPMYQQQSQWKGCQWKYGVWNSAGVEGTGTHVQRMRLVYRGTGVCDPPLWKRDRKNPSLIWSSRLTEWQKFQVAKRSWTYKRSLGAKDQHRNRRRPLHSANSKTRKYNPSTMCVKSLRCITVIVQA